MATKKNLRDGGLTADTHLEMWLSAIVDALTALTAAVSGNAKSVEENKEEEK